jgi:hypothetical protein
MSGDVHVRFCESLRGRFPRATRLGVYLKSRKAAERVMESITRFITKDSNSRSTKRKALSGLPGGTSF